MEEIKATDKGPVYDASGSKIKFLVAVAATVTTHSAPPQRVAFFVRKSEDDILFQGTNAFHKLNIVLEEEKEEGKSNQAVSYRKHRHVSNVFKMSSGEMPRDNTISKDRTTQCKSRKYKNSNIAVTVKSVYLSPGN